MLLIRRAERLDEAVVHETAGIAFEDEAVILPEGVDRVHREPIVEGELLHVAVHGLAPLVELFLVALGIAAQELGVGTCTTGSRGNSWRSFRQ